MTRLDRCAKVIVLSLVLSASIVAGASGVFAETSGPVSFKGKTITMVVGYTAGGSTDVIGRLIGRYLVKYLPGAPTLVVQNMPGTEGVTSINYLVNQTAPDGLWIAAAAAAQIDPLFYPTVHAIYNPLDLKFVGGAGRAGSVMMISKSAMPRLTDMSAQAVAMGAPSAVRSAMQMVIWGGEYLHWNLRWVVGYPGSNDLKLALERGEIDTTTMAALPDIAELMGTGRFQLLLQSGYLKDGKLVARPEFGDAPVFADILAGKIKDPIARKAFDYTNGMTQIGQWFALMPGTPEPIVAAYREAYEKVFQDSEFLQQIPVVAPGLLEMNAADIRLLVEQLADTSPNVLGYIQAMAKKQGLTMAP